MKIKIFDLNIKIRTREEIIKIIKNNFNNDKKIFVSKINSEFLVRAKDDHDFSKILNSSDLMIIDGVGPAWIAKYFSLPITKTPLIKELQAVWQMVYSGASLVLNPQYCRYPIKDRLPGIDAFRLMLEIAEKENVGVYFFGGREGILNKALEEIKLEYPKLIISGANNGYEQKDKAVELINKTNAKLLFVGLGSPEQEEWITHNLPKLKNIKVAVGEGGTLDRIANPLAKAPKWISKLGIEWLWRTFANKNLTTGAGARFVRVWNSVPILIFMVVSYKIKNGQIEVIDEKN